MWKIRAGLAAAGAVLVAAEWLMISHVWTWLIAMLLAFVVFGSAYVIINRELLAQRRSGQAVTS